MTVMNNEDPADPSVHETHAWERHRFKANGDDYRPVKFPPPGPYWCTGTALDCSYAVVVAYLPPGEKLTDWWPEADEVESEPREAITYTDRFARPRWWHGA